VWRTLVRSGGPQLAQRFGNGFSVPNLQNFRKFYLAFSTRIDALTSFQRPIQYPAGTKSEQLPIQYPRGRELASGELPLPEKSYPADSHSLQGFSSQLSWSHYRALMRVTNIAARDFYEKEASEYGWSVLDPRLRALVSGMVRPPWKPCVARAKASRRLKI
jgi:DUF1016 N-terminal domain